MTVDKKKECKVKGVQTNSWVLIFFCARSMDIEMCIRDSSYAEKVVMFPDVPAGDDEIVARIGDADAVLLCYTSQINRSVLEKCPNISTSITDWASACSA